MVDKDDAQGLAATRRRVRWWQIVFFVGLFGAFDTVNIFSTLANRAGEGQVLSLWEPAVWEYSSFVLMLALIPFIAWFNNRVSIGAQTWKWAVPLHLLATVPFSLIHVSGMEGLRVLAYDAVGQHYNVGPPLATWIYEYRKDVLSYWVIVGALYAFHIYRLWLESRLSPEVPIVPVVNAGIERLVVKKLNREFILSTAENRPHRSRRQLRQGLCAGDALPLARIPGFIGTETRCAQFCTRAPNPDRQHRPHPRDPTLGQW